MCIQGIFKQDFLILYAFFWVIPRCLKSRFFFLNLRYVLGGYYLNYVFHFILHKSHFFMFSTHAFKKFTCLCVEFIYLFVTVPKIM